MTTFTGMIAATRNIICTERHNVCPHCDGRLFVEERNGAYSRICVNCARDYRLSEQEKIKEIIQSLV